ncbi:MAG: GMC family oxidoreductase [Nevskia sp.]
MLDARDLPDGQRLTTDLCIVGAGAAGITMTAEFVGTGIDVLVLESGDLRPHRDTQDLNAGTVVDERLHDAPERHRRRQFGGSLNERESRCAPLAPIDFEARAYMPNSGWPFGPEVLAPYYPRALALYESDESRRSYERDRDILRKPLIEGFDDGHFSTETLDRYGPCESLGQHHDRLLRTAGNVCVMLNATATRLQLDATGSRVESLIFRTLTGKSMTVKATRFVIAAGAFETARLLLANRDVHRHGIGNDHDNVGRYYMCHVAGTAGTLTVTRPRSAVHHGYVLTPDGVYARRRFALTAVAQRELKIGNFIARLHFANLNNPAHRSGILSGLYLAKAFIRYEYSKRLHDAQPRTLKNWLLHVRNVVLDPFDTLAFLWHWLTKRTLAKRKFPSVVIPSRANRFSLDFHAEQQPTRDSRITLIDDKKDALGLPQIRVDWRYTDWDIETVTKALALLKDELARSGCGRLDYEAATLREDVMRYGAYGGHHLGTARMGADPATSVVDADCRVHGVPNLSIAGAAVFPTSSQANAQLTVVALALRLAARLAR